MAEETEETKEQEKPRPPKKKVPVKKTKTLKTKTPPADKKEEEAVSEKEEKVEKPKPRPPTKKKKVVKKEEEKKEESIPEKKEEKKVPEKEEKKEEPEEEKEALEEEEEEEEEAEEEEEEEEIEIVEEVETYKVKIKPELSKEVKHKLVIRRNIKKKTPEFTRQEWFRYKKLGTAWRKPRGLHSKTRKHKGFRANVVSIGYGSPAETRNLHPSGFQEIMVHNPADLEKIDPKVQAARIGHSVGTRKRVAIEAKAEELGIRVLNPRR